MKLQLDYRLERAARLRKLPAVPVLYRQPRDGPSLPPPIPDEERETTTDLRGVLKGVLSDHLQVATQSLNTDVFPGSEAVKGLSLLRA